MHGFAGELRGPARTITAVTLAALLALLTGCASVTAADGQPPATSPSPDAVAGVDDVVVLLDCEKSVPAAAAAALLGVPVGDVVEGPYVFDPASSYIGAVSSAMDDDAARTAGLQQCRYTLTSATPDDLGPELVVRVLPNAAAEFALVEPDVNDGTPMQPLPLGDEGFSACRDGEWTGCRAQILIGTTWLSLSMRTPSPDAEVFQDYARGVVESLGALTFAQQPVPARPECGALLSPHDLGGLGGLLDATGGDSVVLDDRASQTAAARLRGGLVNCSWSGSSGDPSVTSSSRVELTILPGAAELWEQESPAAVPSPIALEPVDLSDEPGSNWPDTGVESLGGCVAEQCEVTLLADGVWVTVNTTGTAGLAGTAALAAAAYARYASAV